jgi:hypothetical protein
VPPPLLGQRNKAHQAARNNNDETGATGSSSPRYAPAPR